MKTREKGTEAVVGVEPTKRLPQKPGENGANHVVMTWSSLPQGQVSRPPIDTRQADADLSLYPALNNIGRQFDDIQKVRVAQINRIKAMQKDPGLAPYTAPLELGLGALEEAEKHLEKELARRAKEIPVYEWAKSVRGFGDVSLARLIGITGPMEMFPGISKLWAYLGQHVVDGQAPRRKAGEKANWSPQGRVMCYLIGEKLVMMGAGGPYRAAYDRKRAEYFERERIGVSGCPLGRVHKDKKGVVQPCVKEGEDGSETSAHLHTSAQRYAVKMLLKDLWVEWHRQPV